MNEEMLKMLLSGEVRIVFRKKTNGLIRNLLATLNRDDIPPEQYGTLLKAVENVNSDRIVVWDIETNDWRSFYLNTVIDMFATETKKEINKNEG